MRRINVKYQIVFVLILISCIKIHSQKYFKLANTDLKLENNKAELTFKIKKFKKKETFNIHIIENMEDGSKNYDLDLMGSDYEGVLGKNPKNKSIKWYPSTNLSSIDINLSLSSDLKIPIGKHITRNILSPGIGRYGINKGPHFIWTVAMYTLSGLTYNYYNKSENDYTAYTTNYDYSMSEDLFNKAKQNRNKAWIFGIAAAGIWTIDLVHLVWKIKKINAGKKTSDLYDKRANYIYKNPDPIFLNDYKPSEPEENENNKENKKSKNGINDEKCPTLKNIQIIDPNNYERTHPIYKEKSEFNVLDDDLVTTENVVKFKIEEEKNTSFHIWIKNGYDETIIKEQANFKGGIYEIIIEPQDKVIIEIQKKCKKCLSPMFKASLVNQ